MEVIFLEEPEPGLKFVEEEPYKMGPKYSFSSSTDVAAALPMHGNGAGPARHGLWPRFTSRSANTETWWKFSFSVLNEIRKPVRFLVYLGFKFKIIKVKLWPTKWFLIITKWNCNPHGWQCDTHTHRAVVMIVAGRPRLRVGNRLRSTLERKNWKIQE